MSKDDLSKRGRKYQNMNDSAGGIWFAGFIGALVYYLHYHSGTVWLVILAFLKAMVWPTFVVYGLLKFLY